MTSFLKRAIVQRLTENTDQPIQCELGSPAPAFEGDALMPDGSIKKIKLSDYKGKWLVLLFYPLDFSFVCGSELCSFNDKSIPFDEAQASIVFCSVDSVFSHRAWVKQPREQGGLGGSIRYPMLSDVSHDICSSYGTLFENGEHKGLAMRATFLVDPKGHLRHVDLNELPIGRSADEMLRLVQAHARHDASGDVVPSGWRPGGVTVHGPAGAGIGDFFRAVFAPLDTGKAGTQSHDLVSVNEMPVPPQRNTHDVQTLLDVPKEYGDTSRMASRRTTAAAVAQREAAVDKMSEQNVAHERAAASAAAASRAAPTATTTTTTTQQQQQQMPRYTEVGGGYPGLQILHEATMLESLPKKEQRKELEKHLPAAVSSDTHVKDEIQRHSHHA